MLQSAQKEAAEESRINRENEVRHKRGRIYFDSIKSKVPKLVQTEELRKRKQHLEQ